MNRVFDPTEKLIELKQRDPDLAATIENMCKALLATRGVLIFYQCDAILQYVNKQVEPWARLAAPMTQDERSERFILRHKDKSK